MRPSEACAEMEHGRLGEAAHELVRPREHHVGSGREGVLGQGVVEGEMRAPGLVDDQRHTPDVRDLGQSADVGHGAEVGGRDDHGRDRAGRVGQGQLERLRRDAVSDAEVGIQLRADEDGPQARSDEPVGRAGVGVALDDDLAPELRECEGRWPGCCVAPFGERK